MKKGQPLFMTSPIKSTVNVLWQLSPRQSGSTLYDSYEFRAMTNHLTKAIQKQATSTGNSSTINIYDDQQKADRNWMYQEKSKRSVKKIMCSDISCVTETDNNNNSFTRRSSKGFAARFWRKSFNLNTTAPESSRRRRNRNRNSNSSSKMARGLKKHLKRLNAPKHWMLDKLGGAFAPKPSSGPHKSRECLPLILIIRNRLKYALTFREVIAILMQRHVLVDGKVRTDRTYPAGFMDVVQIPKTNESFRLLYDTKGRFRLHSIRDDEAKFKLCKVRSVQFGTKGIPYLNTYDGRTIRYPDPLIKANDTIKLDLETNKITEFIKFDVGNVVMVTGGRNRGRVGVIKNREKHKGNFDTIHIQDALGHEFATRMGNVFTIGKGTKPWVSLPKGKGIKLSIIEEARKRLAAQA
ncbi:hypothetical protein ACFE04_009484 [Oxalis oulophora]